MVIKDIIQDKYGFIWIATEDGLNKFDGISNVIYRPQGTHGSLNHFFTSELFIDRAGNLWVG